METVYRQPPGSVLCIKEGIRNYRERIYRQAIEQQLNEMTKATEKSKDDNLNFNQPIAVHIRDARALAVFWGQLTEYRNDVAHVQMRKSPFSGKNLEDFALNRLLSSLESIFPTLTQSSDLEENNSNQR